MLNVKLPGGKYVVAVSGGVDSMVLLDILRRQPDLKLVVAHVNHGIRPDASEDKELVHRYAMSHNIEFIHTEVKLRASASEALARQVRYDFLQQCRSMYKADAIVTGQHQDDLVETAIINLLRGTGWRGLAILVHTPGILRPLINLRKSELIVYAKEHNVPWREDSTNTDQHYLRNYVRHNLLPRLQEHDAKWFEKILRRIRKQQVLRRTIEEELNSAIHYDPKTRSAIVQRHLLIMADITTAYELLQQAFRRATSTSVPRPLAESALLFARVAKVGKMMPLDNNWRLSVTARQLIVEPRQPMVS